MNCYIGIFPITLELSYKCHEYHHLKVKSSSKNVSSLLAAQSSADATNGSNVNSTPLGMCCLSTTSGL